MNLKLIFTLATTVFVIGSCSSSNNQINTNNVTNLNSVTKPENKKILIADFNRKKNGVNTGVYINLNIGEPKNGLKIKSADGQLEAKSTDIKSYFVGLCTNKDLPDTSQVGEELFMVNKDGAATITFANVPVGGPYFAVVLAFDGLNATGKLLIKPNNGGTPYLAPDTGLQLAVSSNSVSVSSTLAITFTGEGANALEVTANLKDAVGPVVGTNINPSNGQPQGPLSAN